MLTIRSVNRSVRLVALRRFTFVAISSHGLQLDSSWHLADARLSDTTISSSHVHITACDFLHVVLILLALLFIGCSTPSLSVTTLIIVFVFLLDPFV